MAVFGRVVWEQRRGAPGFRLAGRRAGEGRVALLPRVLLAGAEIRGFSPGRQCRPGAGRDRAAHYRTNTRSRRLQILGPDKLMFSRPARVLAARRLARGAAPMPP